MVSNLNDMRCPKCQHVDRIRFASAIPERFPPPPGPVHKTLAMPLGAFMLAYLLASLPFISGNPAEQLTDWPSALPWLGDLLPEPLIFVVIGASILLVARDRSTRELLRRLGRAATLDSRFTREMDDRPPAATQVVLIVAVASFGWGVFLGLRSLGLWLGMSRMQLSSSLDWVPLSAQGFLVGSLVVLAGWPALSYVMSRAAHLFADPWVSEEADWSFTAFARKLAYPYCLLPLLMGLSQSSGIQALSVVAVGWFLVSMVMAARHTMNYDMELALPTALAGAAPTTLAFFFVTSSVLLRIASSGNAAPGGTIPPPPDVESLWLAFTLALAGALTLAWGLATAWRRWETARADRLWQRASHRWQRLLLCERCDGVHLPRQRGFVPAGQSTRLILGRSGDARAG